MSSSRLHINKDTIKTTDQSENLMIRDECNDKEYILRLEEYIRNFEKSPEIYTKTRNLTNQIFRDKFGDKEHILHLEESCYNDKKKLETALGVKEKLEAALIVQKKLIQAELIAKEEIAKLNGDVLLIQADLDKYKCTVGKKQKPSKKIITEQAINDLKKRNCLLECTVTELRDLDSVNQSSIKKRDEQLAEAKNRDMTYLDKIAKMKDIIDQLRNPHDLSLSSYFAKNPLHPRSHNMLWNYIITLSDEKDRIYYYCGKTSDRDEREAKHRNKTSNDWCKIFGGNHIFTIEEINFMICDLHDVGEDALTLHKMAQVFQEDGKVRGKVGGKVGGKVVGQWECVKRVRGGAFCQSDITRHMGTIKKQICSISDLCFRCFHSGHFAKDCV